MVAIRSVGLQFDCVVQPDRSAVDVGTMGAGKGIDVQLGGDSASGVLFFACPCCGRCLCVTELCLF